MAGLWIPHPSFRLKGIASSNSHHCKLTYSYFILALGTPRKSHFCKSDFRTSPDPFVALGWVRRSVEVKLGRPGVSGWLALGPHVGCLCWRFCPAALESITTGQRDRSARLTTRQTRACVHPSSQEQGCAGSSAHSFQYLTRWSPNLPF